MRISRTTEERTIYDEALALWQDLEQGDVVRVQYTSPDSRTPRKDYFYLVVRCPQEVRGDTKRRYMFANVEKSAFRGSEIKPVTLTKRNFDDMFAYSKKTWAGNFGSNGRLAIAEFERVPATLTLGWD